MAAGQGEYAMVDLQRWVGLLLKERGNTILRTKGVVHAQGGRRFVLQAVHSTFAFEANDHVYVPHGAGAQPQGAGAAPPVAPGAASAAAPKVNRFVFIGRDLHPKDLLEHYQRHLRQGGEEGGAVDESVPGVRVEAWTGMSRGTLGGRWTSSLIAFGVLYLLSRYRTTVTDAMGLPQEWGWLLVVVAVIIAALTKRLF
jgi:hypothetical protein